MRLVEIREVLMEAGSRGIWVICGNAALNNGSTKLNIFSNATGDVLIPFKAVALPENEKKFENDTTDILTWQERRLPPIEQKKLLKSSNEKLMIALDEYRKNNGVLLKNWNIVNTSGNAAFISLWKNSRKQVVAYVKLFNEKSHSAIPFFWSNSDFYRETGYSINNTEQHKVDLLLKPSTLVGTTRVMNVTQLFNRVKNNVNNSRHLPDDVREQVVELVDNVRDGFDMPVSGAAEYLRTYEADLGEIAAPIALMTGNFVSGLYKEVNRKLLKPLGSSWDMVQGVSFPNRDNAIMVDSYLHIDENTKIGISSKNSTGGASTSISSLIDMMDEEPEKYSALISDSRYKKLWNILKLIKNNNAVEGALKLGVAYKFITEEESDIIKSIIKNPHITLEEIPKNLLPLIDNPIYNPNRTSSNYMIGYHLLTSVAYLVCEKLNESTGTVTSFFKQILADSNVIQVTTKMKKDGDDANFGDFNVIWPPRFEGKIIFDAGKTYSSTARPGGKISFKLKK